MRRQDYLAQKQAFGKRLLEELHMWPEEHAMRFQYETAAELFGMAFELEDKQIRTAQDLYDVHLRQVEAQHPHFGYLLHAARILSAFRDEKSWKVMCWPFHEEEDPHSYGQAKLLGLRMLHPSDQAKTGTNARSAVHGGNEETRASA